MASNNFNISYDSDNEDNTIKSITQENEEDEQLDNNQEKNNSFMNEKWRMLRIVGGRNIIPHSLKC